ncbi:MAG: type II secretion system protein M [Rhodocyclaceae bacterium]|nr:type II secretion system protein M [Rhodocyclaceae bacterium]
MANRFGQVMLARLRFALAYPQPLPLLALLLLCAAAFLHLHRIPQHEQAAEAAERRGAAAERALRRLAGEQRQVDDSPAAGRARLLGRYPEELALNATLAQLLDLAQRHGLDPLTGDYRLTVAKEGPLMQYVLTLPLKGDYPSLRRFLAALRSEHPGVAIDDLALRRDALGGTALDTQLRLIVFARREQG